MQLSLPALSSVVEAYQRSMNPDMVLRGQGADPEIIRKRRPALVKAAEEALEIGLPLVRISMLTRCVPVVGVRHGQILVDGGKIWGEDVFAGLAGAEFLVASAVTVGHALEEKISAMMVEDPVLGMALDGVANASVSWLEMHLHERIEAEALRQGFKVSLPYSPGMPRWGVDVGQPQIFHLLEPDPEVIRLNPSFSLIPRKSSTQVVGIGKNIEKEGASPCEFCSMFVTCQYKHNYATHQQSTH